MMHPELEREHCDKNALSTSIRTEQNNPCLKEYDLSLNCLERNNYDKKKCSDYFGNYMICKTFWNMVISDRRKKGIKPYLPLIEDRPKVKEEYRKIFIK